MDTQTTCGSIQQVLDYHDHRDTSHPKTSKNPGFVNFRFINLDYQDFLCTTYVEITVVINFSLKKSCKSILLLLFILQGCGNQRLAVPI